jgi:hypothetical protein
MHRIWALALIAFASSNLTRAQPVAADLSHAKPETVGYSTARLETLRT